MPAAAASRPGWTSPDDVLRTLRRRWASGAFLSAFARGEPWAPLGLPIRGPGPAELAARFAEAQAWAAGWARADPRIRVERKRVGGRAIGVNSIPARAWIDGYDPLWALLRTAPEVGRFTAALDQVKADMPAVADWMIAHPLRVLGLGDLWETVVLTVRWIDLHHEPDRYLRQIDVPGADTKFIEQHRGVLTDLLDRQLAPGRIDATAPRADFAARYRFRRKPGYVRFRCLASGGPFTEMTVRASELAAAPPPAAVVYVVENEVTYLAFPPAAGAIVVFGGGYAVAALAEQPWLAGRELVYWGDLDTHGFSILSRLRRRFPHARSMLMDRATLLAHRPQWVTEPVPCRDELDGLTAEESALHRDLAADLLGPSVRLEQERIRFSLAERFVRAVSPASAP